MIRPAKLQDVPTIVRIINLCADQGLMLHRSQSQVFDHLRDFVVWEADGGILACGALHVVWSDLGEIRSLAVEEGHRGQGIGTKIVESLLREAVNLGLPKTFALTYEVNFFKRLGFEVVPKETLPHKIWRDCLDCLKFPGCDETAMLKLL